MCVGCLGRVGVGEGVSCAGQLLSLNDVDVGLIIAVSIKYRQIWSVWPVCKLFCLVVVCVLTGACTWSGVVLCVALSCRR